MKIRIILFIAFFGLFSFTKAFSQVEEVEDYIFDSTKFKRETVFDKPGERKISDKKLEEARNKLKWEIDEPERNNGISQFSFSDSTRLIFFYVVIAIVIVLIIVFIINGKGIFLRKNVSFEMPSVGSEHDIETFDFDTAIDKAIAESNYRAAVRYMYLQLLKILDEKNILTYSKQRTNSYYLEQLHKTKYFDGFGTLTRLFEYTWYGEMMPDKNRFENIKEKFTAFKSDIN